MNITRFFDFNMQNEYVYIKIKLKKNQTLISRKIKFHITITTFQFSHVQVIAVQVVHHSFIWQRANP